MKFDRTRVLTIFVLLAIDRALPFSAPLIRRQYQSLSGLQHSTSLISRATPGMATLTSTERETAKILRNQRVYPRHPVFRTGLLAHGSEGVEEPQRKRGGLLPKLADIRDLESMIEIIRPYSNISTGKTSVASAPSAAAGKAESRITLEAWEAALAMNNLRWAARSAHARALR